LLVVWQESDTLLFDGQTNTVSYAPGGLPSFVRFLQERDPVIVTRWHSAESAELEEVNNPWEDGSTYCLWNQAILPRLRRIATGKYFNIDSSLPVIEFAYPTPVVEPWNGHPALIQGRIWASFERQDKEFERWYSATVRWIRKSFVRDPAVGHDRDSIGPAAYEWFKNGGLLLPGFRPPTTEAWLAWVNVQNQHRATLTPSHSG
jgi:hypothetical protein